MSITRRQFLLGTAAGLILPSFYDRAYSYFEHHGEPINIDGQMDDRAVLDWWVRKDSSTARAYRHLEAINLGSDFNGHNPFGGLDFINGACPGNDYLGVEALDPVSVSLLQRRLNELGTGIAVRLY